MVPWTILTRQLALWTTHSKSMGLDPYTDTKELRIQQKHHDTDSIENIVEKGEIAHFEQFHLFPQCFPKAFFFNVLKWVYMKQRVKPVNVWERPCTISFWRTFVSTT